MKSWVRRILRSARVQGALAWLIGSYLAFALRTTRWTLVGAENLAPCLDGNPAVVAFWHEHLPLMPALWLHAGGTGRGLRAHVLVSRHRDGRLIGEIMRRFDVALVHGSTAREGGSGKGGAAGLRALLLALQDGAHVVITPDGPRGPRRVAAAGVAQLAALAGVPVLPCAARTSRRHELRSWDRMMLPLPFARGVLVCGRMLEVPRGEADSTLPRIAAALTRASGLALELCP
jgi:lysophospholipid acyltransferase (LPLAT)-like uncharacterized protein